MINIMDPPLGRSEDQCEGHRMTRMTGSDCAVICNLINTHTHTRNRERRTCRCLVRPTPGDLVEGTQEGKMSYLSVDVLVECVRLMPVSLTAARGPGTVCTGAQREPAQVEPLGAPSSQEVIRPPKIKHSSPAHCAHMKRPTRV